MNPSKVPRHRERVKRGEGALAPRRAPPWKPWKAVPPSHRSHRCPRSPPSIRWMDKTLTRFLFPEQMFGTFIPLRCAGGEPSPEMQTPPCGRGLRCAVWSHPTPSTPTMPPAPSMPPPLAWWFNPCLSAPSTTVYILYPARHCRGAVLFFCGGQHQDHGLHGVPFLFLCTVNPVREQDSPARVFPPSGDKKCAVCVTAQTPQIYSTPKGKRATFAGSRHYPEPKIPLFPAFVNPFLRVFCMFCGFSGGLCRPSALSTVPEGHLPCHLL